MRLGYVIVAVILAALAAFCFLTVILWPLGLFFAICAGFLLYRSRGEPGVAIVVSHVAPSPLDAWMHHLGPNSPLGPPPSPPLPVVLPPAGVGPSYTLPPSDAYRSAFLWCVRCQRVQPPGATSCATCGTPL